MNRRDFILIPTFNERRNVELLIPKIFAAMPGVHVMVVDDASPDGTQEAVRDLMRTYPDLELYAHDQKAGFARAYIDAMLLLLEREPELHSVTTMDADLSHDPSYLPEMYRRLSEHDIITGSRYVKGGGVFGWEWWRMLLSSLGNVYYRAVSGLPVGDITAGFNVIRADLLRKLDLHTADAKGYAFMFLLKYRAYDAGARFHEVPIIFKNRQEGESKMNHRIILEALRMPWKYPRITKR